MSNCSFIYCTVNSEEDEDGEEDDEEDEEASGDEVKP